MKFITRFNIFLFILFSLSTNSIAQTKPTPGIEASGTIPILYVNTEDSTSIESKDEYVNAVAWLDSSMSVEWESIGTQEVPLLLEIRGRGNSSWNFDGPKPYKLKFDKKQSFFGFTSNKHWVLLPLQSFQNLYNDSFGLKLGEMFGLNFLVKREMVELILNGEYVGAYMLSENIRVDNGRVDIFEQPDLNEDEDTIPYGWLVEIDNYEDVNQIVIPQPNKSTLRVTYHTPEELSAAQESWLTDQFTNITKAVYTSNRLDRKWEDYIDINTWAKHFLIQEMLHNYDAYAGSCYLYKDKGNEKWSFGPLWDMSWSLDSSIDTLVSELNYNSRQMFVNEIIKFPRFRNAINKHFEKFINRFGTDWIEDYEAELRNKYQDALERSQRAWPNLNISWGYGIASKYLLENIAYLQKRFNSDLQTFTLKVNVKLCDTSEDENNNDVTDEELSLPEVIIDGLNYKHAFVNLGQTVVISLDNLDGYEIKALRVNNIDYFEKLSDNKFCLENIDENKTIRFILIRTEETYDEDEPSQDEEEDDNSKDKDDDSDDDIDNDPDDSDDNSNINNDDLDDGHDDPADDEIVDDEDDLNSGYADVSANDNDFEIIVCDLQGRIIARFKDKSSIHKLNKGVYILITGNTVQKIVIR